MMLLTSAASILLTCAIFIAYEFVATRSETQRQIATLARIVAANSTATLAFQDEGAAGEVLATLKTEPLIVAAALYDDAGELFSIYPADAAPATFPASIAADGFIFESLHLSGFQTVSELPDRPLGALYVRADMRPMYQRFWLYGAIAAGVTFASLLLAYVLSRLLQKQISQPILSLTDTARAISERADFSVRAPAVGGAEFGVLTTAFNQMLEQIELARVKLQSQLGRLDLLQRTTRAIGERQDLPSIYQVILRSLEENLPIDFGCMCRFDATAHTLTVASIGADSTARARQLDLEIGSQLPINENGLARCVTGVLVYEPETGEASYPFPQSLAAVGLHSLVAAPLIVENKVFGVLLVARTAPHAFSSGESEFLRQLSEHVALAAHQVQLYTRLQDAYDELRQSQQVILQQERLRALGQMASGVAHDINNAISPIALYTESLLEHEPGLSERARDYLLIIQRAIDDVAQTVSKMREFYRQGEHSSDRRPVALNPLLEQAQKLTRARWSDVPQERGVVIDVRVEPDADLPPIMGVEGDIRDALTNLIFNAVDAMPEGGRLTIRTRAVEPVSTEQDETDHGKVELEVVDTGTGMDEDARRRCIEPFFTTKGERGTGMGLAMVYGMVNRHNAQIEIDSTPGVGTTMRLLFPALPRSSPAHTFVSSALAPARPMRLLVIDDDPLVSQSLARILEGDGHRVSVADGGQAGVNAFTEAHRSEHRFDVVITDLGMPFMDGRAVSEAVKKMSPTTPVLLLTGWGERLHTERNVPRHVDRMLSKPPKLPELRCALAELPASVAERHRNSGGGVNADANEMGDLRTDL